MTRSEPAADQAADVAAKSAAGAGIGVLPEFLRHLEPPAGGGHLGIGPAVAYQMTSMLRDVIKRNPNTFRIVGPDETASNRLTAIYAASKKTWTAR